MGSLLSAALSPDGSSILPVGCKVCVVVNDVHDDAGVLQMLRLASFAQAAGLAAQDAKGVRRFMPGAMKTYQSPPVVLARPT